MQQNNGWFQLESHRQAGNSNRGQSPSGGGHDRVAGKKVQETRMNTVHRAAASQGASNQAVAPEASQRGQLSLDFQPLAPPNVFAVNSALNGQRVMSDQSAVSLGVPEMKQSYQSLSMPASAIPASTARWANDRILHTKHSQTVGERGPVLHQDSILHETLGIFINEKIPERPVHVKGFGAFGTFRTTNSMSQYTKLSFLQSPGQEVPVMTRFSLAVSTKGTPDTSRNVRGFSTKFYTPEGVFDLLCNHIPVFFVRDGIRFPEIITSLLPSPVNNLVDPQRFWRFAATAPEATHGVIWLYSDAGTVKSFRHIPGHSVNTYVWQNAQGVRRYVKYHWYPVAGEETITRQEAATLAGANPDIAGQDLYDTIAAGTPVQYELRVQLMDPADENRLPYDPLDCTKVWDEGQYPPMPVGMLTLNRNPENYMEQVEKVAFSPANLLEGAELSDDKLLQARANIYWDSQRRRLGEDFRSIPVNHQANWTPDDLVTSGTGTSAEGRLVRSEILKPDDFTQAGEHYQSLSDEGKSQLVDNLAADLVHVTGETLRTVLGYLYNASAELGQRVAEQISADSQHQ